MVQKRSFKHQKDGATTAKSRVPSNVRVLEPTKDKVECHRKQETTHRTALSHAHGHEDKKIDKRSVNPLQRSYKSIH